MKNRPVCQLNLYTLAKPNGNTIYVSKKIKRQIKNDQHRLSNIKLLLSQDCEESYDCENTGIYNLPASDYLFKVKNRNTKTRYEIC